MTHSTFDPMEEVVIIAILLWLRGRKSDSTPTGTGDAGGATGGSGGSGASGASGGTIATPAMTGRPTPTSGIEYRPTPPPTVPLTVLQPPVPQVPQIVTPATPLTPIPVTPLTPIPGTPTTPPPQVRDPRTPPGPTLVPGWDDGRPAFCGREWVPVEMRECRYGEQSPSPRTGVPPPGTLVVAYAPPWTRRYASQPSCPYSLGQGGLHVIEVGSPEWNQVCGPANPTQEI